MNKGLNKIEHMKMIQSIIERMSRNSFALKGWVVTLVAGIFVLSDKDADRTYFFIAYIPIIIFWGIDSYYLLKERLFRKLYNNVRCKEDSQIDFNMDTSDFGQKRDYLKAVFSKSELGFYFPLALVATCIAMMHLLWK